jgi:hypothetical protein
MSLLPTLVLAAAVLAAGAAAADPKDEARVRQIALGIPTNVDLRNFDAIEPLFADPVVIDYTSLWGGEPQTMSPRALMDAWRGIVPGFDATWHEISDLQVKVNGDRATATSRVDGRHWLGEQVWRPIGRYDFQFARQGGAWKVTRMTLVVTEERGDRKLVDEARRRTAAVR